MSRDRMMGGLILAGGIVGIVVYGWLLLSYSVLVLQVTAFLAVAAMLGISAWIGWTMATTPPPAPLEMASKPLSTDTSAAAADQK